MNDWSDDVFGVLREFEVRQVPNVPDAGLDRLLGLCGGEPSMRLVPLTTEEEGVAVVAGASLGGQRAVLLLQSSGIGNIVNMLSMIRVCRFPLLIIATMRGEAGEGNPWQVPMGANAEPILTQAGVGVQRAEKAEDIGGLVHSAAEDVFSNESAQAVLVAQSVIGVKEFEAAT